MKRTLIIAGIIALLVPSAALAQSASGTLAVTATVESTFNLVFDSAATGVTLGGAGTNAATLAFGNVSAYGTIATANVTRTVNGTTDFTVSSPLLVIVTKANSASANFTMAARVDVANANAVAFGGTTLTTADQTITSTGAYGAAGNSETVALTIPFATGAGAITKNITVTATPN